jgi:hypothetical protein
MLTGTSLAFEESKKVIGMIHETPKPTRRKPITITAGEVNMIEIKNPVDKRKELNLMILDSPYFAINLSPKNLPINMAVK